jgi:uncharacterized protein (DUF58 family)
MPDAKEILKRVKKLDIKTRKIVETLMQGEYHSVFKGRGIEFSDVREYALGDDIRTIDWNITARMNHPYVKEFIEERNLTIYIVFDISKSYEFGSLKQKKESAIELAASIMFSAIRNNDKVGLCLFTNDIERFITPKTGKRQVMKIIREILYYEPKNNSTDLRSSLIKLGNIVKKRSVIFILSDFFSEDFVKPLSILKKRHDVIAINMRDIREEEIPDVGYIELEDSETGEHLLVNTSDKEFRKNYTELVKQKNLELDKSLKKIKIDMIQLKSGEDFILPIKKFFSIRERRLTR